MKSTNGRDYNKRELSNNKFSKLAAITGSIKRHKKHKKDKCEEKSLNGERPTGLKLILKVGNSSTPEHSDSPGNLHNPNYTITGDDESLQSSSSFHKKSKKKKKKKDRDHDKHDRKKRHHHKEKKKKMYDDQSSQDGISYGEESLAESPSAVLKDTQRNNDGNNDSGGGREPRLCVQLLRQKQTKSAFTRMLEYLQKELEKKDPQQFFAWPVTDQIAPGYSQTITHPMDFSTMRQKTDDNLYTNLNSYVNDLKLMCNNAMIYNHADTIYYKAAKRLLHAGLKLLSADKLRLLSSTIPFINEIPAEQLGFQMGSGIAVSDMSYPVYDSQARSESDSADDKKVVPEVNVKRKLSVMPESKFESIKDDLTPEEITEQAQKSSKVVADKLSLKKPKTNMGFLRQQQDGSTSLAIFVPGDGTNPDRPREKPITLGQLVGKLSHGSGQLQGFREDRRNVAKTVKTLNYGAFGSYAPSYDSTFANLSKEESDLIYETYGDDNATTYAESVLNFAKDCDYTLNMVDNLLDLLTGGEHRKAKSVIDEQRKFREEEEKVRELMESKPTVAAPLMKAETATGVKIELDQLKTLADLGIDTSFLSNFEHLDGSVASPNPVQDKLEHTTNLIEKLHQVQNERLSAPPPTHLSNILPPSETELNLAEKITESLTELAKQVPPGALIPVPAIRKAMGIVNETMSVSTSTNTPATSMSNSVEGVVALEGESSGDEEPCVAVGQLDLESELRELLESDTALTNFSLHDDKTIEEMLSES